MIPGFCISVVWIFSVSGFAFKQVQLLALNYSMKKALFPQVLFFFFFCGICSPCRYCFPLCRMGLWFATEPGSFCILYLSQSPWNIPGIGRRTTKPLMTLSRTVCRKRLTWGLSKIMACALWTEMPFLCFSATNTSGVLYGKECVVISTCNQCRET